MSYMICYESSKVLSDHEVFNDLGTVAIEHNSF